MDRALSMLAGVGLGAGLMYLLDPQMGRRRRALVRDKVIRLGHEARDAAEVVGKDMSNRARGLASGDLSVLAGGKRALQNPLRGGWSPAGRALMTGLGAGLFLWGLTRRAPTACILGTLGAALAAEGVTNAGPRDIADAAGRLADRAKEVAGGIGVGSQAEAGVGV
jgi:hypothetical protein